MEKSRALRVKPCKTCHRELKPWVAVPVPIHFLKPKSLVPSGGHMHVASQVVTLPQLAGLSVPGWVLPSLKTEPKGNIALCSTQLIPMGRTFRVLVPASASMLPKVYLGRCGGSEALFC